MTLATIAEKWIERTELIIASLIQLAFLAIAVSSPLNGQWLTAFSATLVLFLSFAPAYLERQPYFQTMPRFLVHETAIHLVDVFRFLLGEISRSSQT